MEGGRYLVLYIYAGVPGKNMLAYQDLHAPNPRTVMLIPSADYGYGPIGVVGSKLYLQTNDGAPREPSHRDRPRSSRARELEGDRSRAGRDAGQRRRSPMASYCSRI